MFGLTASAARRMAHAAALTVASLILILTSNGVAEAETRTLKLYHVHLRERVEVTYKRNGRFLAEGLKQANWALRDWRESKPTEMDPHLLDMLWEIHRRSGSRDYINIIGGYRSPQTNRTLRSRSSGVADNSQHTQGKAIDFFIPDVPLSRVRAIALQLQAGGVGYYPRSGSPFIHIDTGNGRYWPRMNRNELARIFPNGNTIYLPADGRPLPGYETAMAAYKQRRSSGSIQMDSGRSGGPTLLARLFGGGAEEAEDNADAAAAPPPAPARRPAAPQRAAPAPQVQVAAAQPPRPAAMPAGVAMPDRETFDTSSRTPTPRAGIPEQQAVAQATIPTRVPVPTNAPARAAPVVEDAPAAAESTLVAALEAQAPVSAAELAYAVPMPSRRPPFEMVLEAAAVPVPLVAPQAQQDVAAAETQDGPDARTSISDILVAARSEAVATPLANPRAAAEIEPAQLADDDRSALVAALEAEADAFMAPAATETPAESPSGKSGRVLHHSVPRSSSVPVAVDDAITSRIEIASLAGEQEGPAGRKPGIRQPSAAMLVVDVPVSTLAIGFSPQQSPAASDRFSGSALNLAPARASD